MNAAAVGARSTRAGAAAAVGPGLAATGIVALLTFGLALREPTFVNLFWQIAEGIGIARGHLPATNPAAIEAAPLLAHEWLFELAAGVLTMHGAYAALVIACAAAAALTPLLVYRLAVACGGSSAAATIVAFLTVGARWVGSSTRPETFAVDLFALELIVVAGALPLWCALPFAVLWANLHASAPLAVAAPLLVAAVSAGAERRITALAQRAALVAAIAALGTLATPYGVRLWPYAWGHGIAADASHALIDTWAPLSFATLGAWTGVLPGLVLAAACGVVVRRRTLPELALAAAMFAATLLHQRYAVFLCVAWAVPLARALDARTQAAAFEARLPRVPVLALVPLVLFFAVSAAQAPRAPQPTPAMRTAEAIVLRYRLSGNAYVDMRWAGYLTAQGLPLRTLIDGHADSSYPAAVWADAAALERGTPGWAEVLRRRGIRVAIVRAGAPLAQLLDARPDWRLIERRAGVAAFARR